MTKAPCKDCTDRHAGCHAGCEKYLSWCKIHEQEKAVIRKAKDESEEYRAYIIKSIQRRRRSLK